MISCRGRKPRDAKYKRIAPFALFLAFRSDVRLNRVYSTASCRGGGILILQGMSARVTPP
jgi:hypothetical protein